MDALRIGDADREEAVRLLGEQYAVGRLTKDELDERSDAAWSARTRGDLAPLFADLPVRSPALPERVERQRGGRGLPGPLLPVLVVLVAITVLTHLPVVLLGLVLWFGFFRWRSAPWLGGARWAGHRHRGWHDGRTGWSRSP